MEALGDIEIRIEGSVGAQKLTPALVDKVAGCLLVPCKVLAEDFERAARAFGQAMGWHHSFSLERLVSAS